MGVTDSEIEVERVVMDGGMMCGGGMALGGLFVLLLFAMVGYIAYQFGKSKAEGSGTSAASRRADDALEVARIRYARGEITSEEYETLRRDLG